MELNQIIKKYPNGFIINKKLIDEYLEELKNSDDYTLFEKFIIFIISNPTIKYIKRKHEDLKYILTKDYKKDKYYTIKVSLIDQCDYEYELVHFKIYNLLLLLSICSTYLENFINEIKYSNEYLEKYKKCIDNLEVFLIPNVDRVLNLVTGKLREKKEIIKSVFFNSIGHCIYGESYNCNLLDFVYQLSTEYKTFNYYHIERIIKPNTINSLKKFIENKFEVEKVFNRKINLIKFINFLNAYRITDILELEDFYEFFDKYLKAKKLSGE